MTDTRESVQERVEEIDDVNQTAYVANGLRVILKTGHNEVMTFTKLTEDTGWYIAEYESGKNGNPDQFILAPMEQ